MTKKSNLTVVVLTMNEEKNIVKCINSVNELAERVVVVDSGSTDNTMAIAESMGADVYYHEFENYASQFNWGLDNTEIKTKWVLRLDADEVITPELAKEMVAAMEEHEDDGQQAGDGVQRGDSRSRGAGDGGHDGGARSIPRPHARDGDAHSTRPRHHRRHHARP